MFTLESALRLSLKSDFTAGVAALPSEVVSDVVEGWSDAAPSSSDGDGVETMKLSKLKCRCRPCCILALASISSNILKDTFGDKRTGEPLYEKGPALPLAPTKEHRILVWYVVSDHHFANNSKSAFIL